MDSRNLVYIGNSGSLSFLHYIRRIVAVAIGRYTFTEDVYLSSDSHRHQMIETVPLFDVSAGKSNPPDVEVEQAIALTTQFTLATEGLLDLFEHYVLLAEICRVARSPNKSILAKSLSAIPRVSTRSTGSWARSVGRLPGEIVLPFRSVLGYGRIG